MKYKTIKYRKEDNLGIVSFDCPPANAFAKRLVEELDIIFDHLCGEDRIRTVLLTSSHDKIFLSGGDIKSAQEVVLSGKIEEQINYVRSIQKVVKKLERMPKPTTACINGHALGGGFEMVMACDYRLVLDDDKIQLGMPEIDLGFIPALGGLQRISKICGKQVALKMGMGLRLNVREALNLGLVDEVYPADSVLEESMAFAKRLGRLPTKAVAMIKEILTEGFRGKPEEIYELELRFLRKVMQTEDVKEGIGAFLTKRKPKFKGV